MQLPFDTPSTVVFDLGGVLVDWDPRHLYRKLLPSEADVEWFLSEICTPEWNAAQDAGRPWSEAVAELSARFPAHAGLIAAYDERWPEMVAGDITGAVDVLRSLRDGGTRLYALTNWSAEKFELAYARFEWLSWFEGIVVSGREILVKPDPRIYRLLLDRYGIDPARTVYVDDVERNVAVAAGLGMTGLRFVGPERMSADLARLGLPSSGRRRAPDPLGQPAGP